MKQIILELTFILCISFFISSSCNIKKHYMEDRQGNLYATQEGDNYPYIVHDVYLNTCCSDRYIYTIKNMVWHMFLKERRFEIGDTLLLIEKHYLDSLLKK